MSRHSIAVTVESARGLRAADITGTSDPFAEVYIGDYRGKARGVKQKTNTVRHTLNPFWNQTFTFNVSNQEISSSTLVVKLLDWDRFKRNDKLGYFVIPLARLMAEPYQDNWFPLTKSLRSNLPDQGQLHLIISVDGKTKPTAQPGMPGAPAAPYQPQYAAQPMYMGGGQQPAPMPMQPPQKPNKYPGLGTGTGTGTGAGWQAPADQAYPAPAGVPGYPAQQPQPPQQPPYGFGGAPPPQQGYPGAQAPYGGGAMGFPPMQPPPQQPMMGGGGYPYGGNGMQQQQQPQGLGTPASYLPSGFRPPM